MAHTDANAQRRRKALLREAWFLGRHFWMVQGGNTWEIFVTHATASHPWSSVEWALCIDFAKKLEPGNHPSISQDADLYPQKLSARLERVSEHAYGLRVFMFNETWAEVATIKAPNMGPG